LKIISSGFTRKPEPYFWICHGWLKYFGKLFLDLTAAFKKAGIDPYLSFSIEICAAGVVTTADIRATDSHQLE
jgi:hypothetical protein